jgi:predicted aldo/keto reductase-like oxidoreductase
MMLSKHPEVELVQLQINYIDWESDNVQSRKCYEICKKYGIPVSVMEPVKGGSLANIMDDAKKVFTDYNPKASMASWAVRYCASLDDVMVVLSGMSNMEQLRDNIS